ncbi:F-box/FBD/LRR-repeat protein At1g78750-like [Lotus japonicus]|uniref:F-box/FBD/LRR-repeat protein At1g78750-like n=1 Tax=Lotus japonicus TaxID=34305 RepID=UPI002587F7D8|nr:F-box/FBD/LRR-repeat protein At1g78750-like [Lotus japonicus]
MVDRISALPDELLCHILTFLPTKDAVAAGLLSKRWRPLWRSVSALDFSFQRMHRDYYDHDGLYFSNIVYSVLLFRDPATPIKKFNLELHDVLLIDKTVANISKWINFMTQCRVGIEHLCLHVNAPYRLAPKLPISILSCRTLVVLKLCGLNFNGVLSTGLPSLKILHIKNVEFTSAVLLKEFLAGCPILENLKSGRIRITGKSSTYRRKLASLCLPNLQRADIVHSRLPLQPFSSVTFLRADIEKV